VGSVRRSTLAFAAAYVVLVLGLFLALGGAAYATSPSSAADQYGTKVAGVEVSAEQEQPEVQAGSESLPNTGLSLLGTVLVGGALVGLGIALRRREGRKGER
jgi:LPXTG-motif cell wall-anchored protein